MATLNDQKKLAGHICRLLKVTEIIFPIARTHKGNLGLAFNVNNDDYVMMLDSVPLSVSNPLEDENNIELKKMIEKYLFSEEITVYKHAAVGFSTMNLIDYPTVVVGHKKKKGRPKGSKNVKKIK